MSSRSAGVTVFACFAAAYFLSYALRSVNAAISPDLIADLGLSNAQLGSLSSAYFFAFACLQLPLGIWLDRYGARRTDATLLTVASLGCAVFAMATSLELLWVGRALIGMGVAGALMSALKGYRFWYAPGRQQQLAAWMLVAGTAGALSSTVPVQRLLPLLGWRGVFWLAAALLLLSALALWTLVPRDEERSLAPPVAGASQWSGYRQVFASGYFWRFGFVAVVAQSNFISMQSLWAGPWFVQVLGMSPAESANALFVFNMLLLMGYLVMGWALPRMEARGWTMVRITAIGSTAVILLQTGISVFHEPWAWLLWPVLAVCSTFFTSVQPHVTMAFPKELTGRAYTGFNLLIFSGIFLNQWVFGVSVDHFTAQGATRAAAFSTSLQMWVALQLVALIVLVAWKVGPPARPGEAPGR